MRDNVSDRDHPVDEAVRRAFRDLEPSDEERQMAKNRLLVAIEAEKARESRRRRWWPWIAAAAVVAAVFLGLQVAGPTPTEAAMEEIATVAAAIEPAEVGDQEFLFTESENAALAVLPADMLGNVQYDDEFLAYRLPATRRTWFGSDGVVQIRTTNREPTFFSDRDESAYYAAGLDEIDAIGETTTDTIQQDAELDLWPTDTSELDSAIRDQLPETGRPQSVEYLDSALDLIREVFTPPELRASVLTLIGRIPDLQLVERDQGRATFAIEYEDRDLQTRQTFTVSRRGELLAEERLLLEPEPELGIPANTVTFTAEYSTPDVVDSLDEPEP